MKKDSIEFYFKDEFNLFQYVTTKQDRKLEISKKPQTFPLFVKPEDYLKV